MPSHSCPMPCAPCSSHLGTSQSSGNAMGSPCLGGQRGGWSALTRPKWGRGPLTQQCGATVPQRVALVAGDAKRRQGMEPALQQWLQAGG